MIGNIPSQVYSQLFHLIEIRIKTLLGDEASGLNRKDMWNHFFGSPHSTILYQTKRNKDYFTNKYEDTKKKHILPIHKEMFCDALQFIGYELPLLSDGTTDKNYAYFRRYSSWGIRFLEKEFPENPEFVDILFPPYEEKENSTSPKSVEYNIPDRITSLDDKFFIAEYTHGNRNDKASIHFKVDRKKLLGKIDIIFQSEQDTHFDKVKFDIIQSYSFNEDLIILVFTTKNSIRKQFGTMMINWDISGEIMNACITMQYDKIPKKRKTNFANAIFHLSNLKNSTKFMNSNINS